ncbi:hypothetical protein GCM10025857_01580 [Alicyclobacillus contaminans]|nr:hypothetical protein GCM10025857_01580 [Alicyclobacillus contaminans]
MVQQIRPDSRNDAALKTNAISWPKIAVTTPPIPEPIAVTIPDKDCSTELARTTFLELTNCGIHAVLAGVKSVENITRIKLAT